MFESTEKHMSDQTRAIRKNDWLSELQHCKRARCNSGNRQ